MVEQLHAQTLTGGPRPVEFILSELPMSGSRRAAIFSMTVKPGQVVGQITVDDEPTVTADGGNTGNGVLTLADPPTGAGVKAGEYVLTITGGTRSAAAGTVQHVLGSTSDGTIALANPAFAADAKVGVWRLECIEKVTNGGKFAITDPDGAHIAVNVVGAAYDGDIKFTISDGGTDFEVGDYFLVTVSHAVPANGLGTFSVVDPQGIAQESGVVGTAYAHELRFTLADGNQNFVVGDTITIEVAVGDDTYGPFDGTAVDGRAVAAGISLYGHTLGAGERADGVILSNDAQVKAGLLIWPTSPAEGVVDAAIAALWASHRIRVR